MRKPSLFLLFIGPLLGIGCVEQESPSAEPYIRFVTAPGDVTGTPGTVLKIKALAETNSKVGSVRYVWERLVEGDAKDFQSGGETITVPLSVPSDRCGKIVNGYHVIAIVGELSLEQTFSVTSFDAKNCASAAGATPGLAVLSDAALVVDPAEALWTAPGQKVSLNARLSNGAPASFLWEQLNGAGGAVSFSNTSDIEITAPSLRKNCESQNIILKVTASDGSASLSRTISIFVAEPICTLTKADGLISDKTTKILIRDQDPLVVGTEYGVSHYDGVRWESFTKAGNNRDLLATTALAEAPDQTVWIGNANNAFVFYDGRGIERLTRDLLWESSEISTRTGLQGKYVTQISFDTQTLPGFATVATQSDLATTGGATRGSLPSFSARTTLIDDQGVFATLRDQYGNRWFGTGVSGAANSLRTNSGILVFSGISKRTTFSGSEWDGVGATRFADNRDIRVMVIDTRGDIWIGLHSGSGFYQKGGLVKFTPTQGDPIAGMWSKSPELFSESSDVRALAPDGRGNIWIATALGLVRRQAAGDYTTITKSDGLGSNDIRDVFYDPETRYLWVATSAGVTRIVEPLFPVPLSPST